MLRLLLHNKPANIASGKTLSRSLFNSNKAQFSNLPLEEGEYIDGDFDAEILGSGAPSQVNQKESEIKQKYVTFDNFGHNLTRQTPKPAASYQKEISNSIINLKSKFNFELAKEDEFAQELSKRKKTKPVTEKSAQKLSETRKAYQNMMKETLEKLHKNRQKPDVEKNLVKIEFNGLINQTKEYNPVNMYTRNIVDKITEDQKKTAKELETYAKGQEGIDYISPGEDPTRVMQNLQAEVINDLFQLKEAQRRNLANYDKLNEWRIRKEQTTTNLVITEDPIPYPGSSKGPHPRDDLPFFAEWLTTHMPDSHKKFYAELITKIRSSRKKVGRMEPTRVQLQNIIESPVPNSDFALTKPLIKSLKQKDTPLEFSSFVDTDKGEISPFIENVTTDYQNSQFEIENWTMFRMYPLINNWMKNMYKAVNDLQSGKFRYGKDPVLPTLFRYYNLLPEFARMNHIVIDVARGLEFTKHDMTLKEKELALNYAAQFTLPLEADLESAVKEAVISTKYFVPLWEEIVLTDENREVEKDDTDLPGMKKKRMQGPVRIAEDYLGEGSRTIPEDLQNIGDWPAPPKMDPYVPEEDPFPILPLDYYDNDDGFWDDYIAAKERSYDEIPMIVNRPHFKH